MATPAAIRAALSAAIKARLTDVQVSDHPLSNPTSKAFEIDLDDEGVNYDEAMSRGLDEWWFLVRGFVAETTDVGASVARDDWLASSGSTSVKEAIEVDRTLGGACQSCRVLNARPRRFSSATSPNTTYTAAEWRVRVMATG